MNMSLAIYTKFKNSQTLSPSELETVKSVKVVQPSVMYVIGVRSEFCQEDLQRSKRFFGKYGPVESIRINKKSINTTKDEKKKLYRVYVTYKHALSSAIAILSINMNASTSKSQPSAAFSANKLCKFFIKGKSCLVKNCSFLHKLGNPNLILSEGINVSETLSFETQKKFVIEIALENFKNLKKLNLDSNKNEIKESENFGDLYLPDQQFAVDYIKNQISASNSPSLEKKVYQQSKKDSITSKSTSSEKDKENSFESKSLQSFAENNTISLKSKVSLEKSQDFADLTSKDDQEDARDSFKNFVEKETQEPKTQVMNASGINRFNINNLQKDWSSNESNWLNKSSNDQSTYYSNSQNYENFYDNGQNYYTQENSCNTHSNYDSYHQAENWDSGLNYNQNNAQQQNYDSYMMNQNNSQDYTYAQNINQNYHETSNLQNVQNNSNGQNEMQDYLLRYYLWNEYYSKNQQPGDQNQHEQMRAQDQYNQMPQYEDLNQENYYYNNTSENTQKPNQNMQDSQMQPSQNYSPFGFNSNFQSYARSEIDTRNKQEDKQRIVNIEHENTRFINKLNVAQNLPSAFNKSSLYPFLGQLEQDLNA